MSKNKKNGKALNGNSYIRNEESDKLMVAGIDNISKKRYAHIKEERISVLNEENAISKALPYDTSIVKVEINEEFDSKRISSVPSKLKKETSLISTSSASSPGSDRSLSPAHSSITCTLSLPYQTIDSPSTEILSKSPIYIPGRKNTDQTLASSSSQSLQHYVLINSSPYQMIVPSHGIHSSSQSGMLQGQLGRPVQLQLMSKQNSLPATLSSVSSTESKLISKDFNAPKLNQYRDLQIQNADTFTNYSSREIQGKSSSNNNSSKVPIANKFVPNDYENDYEDEFHSSCHSDKNSNSFSQEQLENVEHDLLEMDSSPSLSQENLYQGSDSECSIPNLLNDSGKYGFKVYLDDKKDTLKTPTWLMSNITKKLYTNMNKPVPFRVILKKLQNLKKKFHLRAMAVFKYPMFLRHNVVRCPHHLNPLDPSNADFTDNLNHVIRADHPRAIYESSQSGRLSVVVPLDFPENRKEAVPVLLKFMCHNSCVGGISRRPLAVLLTLELNGEELGRSIIDVRVCACPSRDVRSEEKQVISRGLYKKTISHTFVGRRARKRQRPDEIPNLYDEQDEIMFIPVRGVNLYNYLIEMKSLYLKHHADYADKYPDPPLEIRPMDDTSSNFNGNINNHPSTSISINSEEAGLSQTFNVALSDEHEDPVYVASSNSEENQHYVIQSDLQVALLSDDSGENSDSSQHMSCSKTQNGVIMAEQQSTSAYEDDIHHCNGYQYNKLSNKKHSNNSKKMSNSEGSFATNMMNNINRTSSKNSSKKSVNKRLHKSGFASGHLQTYPMPEKSRRGGSKSFNHNSENHVVDYSNEESDQSFEKINESEKVMLAAQVLASHLGSQCIDK